MNSKDTYIAQLENTIENLERQVNNLTEMVILLRKQKFGSSSEKTPKADDGVQLNIFNEVELEASPEAQEPATKRVDGYYRKNSKTNLVPVSKEVFRGELEYIPAQLKIIRYVLLAYGCSKCKQKGTPYIVKALTPTSLMNHSITCPTAVANVMYQKYVNNMPLYRQEKE